MNTMQALAAAPLFEEFPDNVLARLEEKSTVRQFKKNTQLIVCGDECYSVYLLMSGSANAYIDNAEGNEFIVGTFREGDIFGELGVLGNQPRTAHVVSTSACECLVIPKAEILHAMENEPVVALTLVKILARRIQNMTDDVSCLALMDVYGRLARVLKAESELSDDGVAITGKLTHQELSQKVGASREMVSKILKDLKTGGYIDTQDRRIVIQKSLPERW